MLEIWHEVAVLPLKNIGASRNKLEKALVLVPAVARKLFLRAIS